jgi:peptidoglycan/xylan/chitin deacetylase (PgdA/CDA1 family)
LDRSNVCRNFAHGLFCGRRKSIFGGRGQSIESYCAFLVELARDQRVTQDNCGILRGPRDRKKIALIFTGGSFAEGYADAHRALTAVNVKASFFFTGDFLRADEFQPLVHELLSEGHYIGPHSDRHLTLVDEHGQTLVPRNVFDSDLRNNLMELARSGVDLKNISFWIPPDETYNREISEWSFDFGVKLFNFSPGTYSNTDYLGDHEPGFTDNETIENSILDLAARPGGLNGFLLLLHLGAGPERRFSSARDCTRCFPSWRKWDIILSASTRCWPPSWRAVSGAAAVTGSRSRDRARHLGAGRASRIPP